MYDVIIVAGGKGRRSKLGHNKVLHQIAGKSIIEHASEVFLQDTRCSQVIIVAAKDDISAVRHCFPQNKVIVIEGGETRTQSVKNGLEAVNSEFVLIHDGARPFIAEDNITAILDALKSTQSVTLALPVYDTVKRVHNQFIENDISRESLVRIQTPQGFHASVITKAHAASLNHSEITCDASLVQQALAIPAKVVEGDQRNIKFTTQNDLELLELILDAKDRL